nr:hypothetical protein [Mycoplasmopsis bovis]
MLKQTNGKEIIFMGDRADHYLMQVIDGKAVSVAGVSAMSTDAQNVNPSKLIIWISAAHFDSKFRWKYSRSNGGLCKCVTWR